MRRCPPKTPFPHIFLLNQRETRKFILRKVLENSVMFISCKRLPITDGEDYVKNYALCFIFLTILILQLKDTAAEADGERNLINQKLLLSVFKSMGAYSKYAWEMFPHIAQMECMLTLRLTEEVKWGFFVNWRGALATTWKMTWHKKYPIG